MARRRLADTVLRPSVREESAHAPLLEAIAANPGDPAAWAVYADLLQTEDHPRGDLISLMMERERRPSVRLRELQRKLMATHAAELVPTAIDRERVVAWRRGFPSEIRIDAPEQLAEVQSDPTLRFIERATLVIESSAAWRKALRTVRMPWRQARIEVANKTFDVAALLACAPALETLRVVFAKRGKASWKTARGARLKRVALVNAGSIESLADAELPALEELKLLGDSVASAELRSSLWWNRLRRVVLAEVPEDDAELGPAVLVAAPIAYPVGQPTADDGGRYDEDPLEQPSTIAFVVVAGRVDRTLIRKLAIKMSIPHLSLRIASFASMTVMQFFSVESELLPYGLALALHHVLEAVPIVLVETDPERAAARYLVLADTQVRGKSVRAGDAVSSALDVALGYDPGPDVFLEILEELAVTPVEVLVGNGGTEQLTMIDPSTAPLVVPEEIEPYEDEEDEDDDDSDPDDWGDNDVQEARSEPPPILRVVTVPAETSGDAEDEVDLVFEDVEVEDALEEQPVRAELWFEFSEHWRDRAVAVDDEVDEARWPDPEHVGDEDVELENRVAEPECARHRRLLDHCNQCGAPHCAECGGEDLCSACFAVVVGDLVETTVPVVSSNASPSPRARRRVHG